MKPLLLAFTLALAAPITAQTAPANWQTQTRDGGARSFAPPDLVTGEIYSVTVYPAVPLDGTLQNWLSKFGGTVGKNAGQLGAPLVISPAGDKAVSASGNYNAPGGGSLGVIFSAFSLDGENVVATRTLFSDAALLPRYQKQSAALTTEIIQGMAREANASLWDKANALKLGGDLKTGVYEGWQIQYGNDYITADQARAKLRLEIYDKGEFRLSQIGGKAEYRGGGTNTFSYNRSGELTFPTALSLGLGTGGHYTNNEDQFCLFGRDANGTPVIYAANQYPSRETILRYVGPTDATKSPAALRAKAKSDAQKAAEAAKYKWIKPPGQGVQIAQIAAVINQHDVQISAGGLAGMVSDVTDEVYLLLKDGTARRGLPIPPDELDIAKSRQNEPTKWGKWRAGAGTSQWIVTINGATQKVDAAKAIPTDKLVGTYRAYSSSSTVFGGSYGESAITFTTAGRFSQSSRGGSYGNAATTVGGVNTNTTFDDDGSTTSARGGGVGVEARNAKNNPRGDREGVYSASGYALTLRYDNGKIERLPLLKLFDGGAIWLDGTRMSRDK